MRALAPMPRERLHDLSHHTEQLTVAVNLPGTVTLRASVLAEHSTDPFFPRPFPAPRSAGRIPPSGGDARGKSVWAGCLLEDQHV